MPSEDHVIYATDDDFGSVVEQSDVPVLVDFWAPWCKPCLALEPTMQQLAAEYQGRAKIVKVNSDEATTTAERFGVRGIPNVMLFSNGEKQINAVGVQPKKVYARFIDDALAAVETGEAANPLAAMLPDNDFRMNFIASGEMDELRKAIAQNPEIATRPFDSGMTPIALVMRRRNGERIDLILSAEPELTAVELAGLGRKEELLAALEATPEALNAAGSEGITPLGQAIAHDRYEISELLLNMGADPNLPKVKDSPHIPAVIAVLTQNTKMLKLLIGHGADLSVTARGGSTLLHIAAMGSYSNGQGHLELLDVLMAHGMEKAIKDGSGKTPLEALREMNARRQSDDSLPDAVKEALTDRLAQLTRLLA